MKKTTFTNTQADRVSEFLQKHMHVKGIKEMTADECAALLAKNKILPDNVGPKPGFNFRQMLRDGKNGKINPIKGAFQAKPRARWIISLLD